MIDTIVIKINKEDFEIKNHDLFSPSTIRIFEPPFYKSSQKFFRCKHEGVKNPFVYYPQVELIRRVINGGYEIYLRISFSIPKLLLGNNFEEVGDGDFDKIILKLAELLSVMQIDINSLDALRNAKVLTIHYSKNFVFKDYTTAYEYISELMKGDISKIYDINRSEYRNEGYAMRYHTNNFEVILYDKVKDLQQAKKSEKRAIENDNHIQFDLLKTVKIIKPFEVLRLEVRLGNLKTIKKIFNKVNLNIQIFNFTNLYSAKISKAILFMILNDINSQRSQILFPTTNCISDILIKLLKDNPDQKLNSILSVLGANLVINECGVRGFRQIIDKYGDRNWYKLKNHLDEIKTNRKINPINRLFDMLQAFQSEKFENHV